MRVRVLLFAAARERTGQSELELDLSDGATVASVRSALQRAHPGAEAVLAACRIAVNEEFASADRALAEGETVAVLPPVSGG